uniref:Catalase n=1 Tax=Tanacetum cinerariifolium TaxID=118510 RepID=A0A6L2NXD2_TANCI|nr:catalase [Tanacetum cinerariifolium]
MSNNTNPPVSPNAKSELAGTDTLDRGNTNAKVESLETFRSDATGEALRTNQGVKISDNQNTLKVGSRGPSLLEDFIMREKITHFDHERIPERIVHARGTAAHGYFQTYENHSALSKAEFLRDPGKKTPVFVRFSTVQGPRGSGDTVRDVRGFAVKFYTGEGNYDLVGNNMPVFFIQDAIKFPDFVHAVKPEPHNEIPTGGSAHDTFWDFVSLFDFDLLDPTKIIPEELVPVTPLGKMVLNRNPDNYFAETEQVAFCPGHVVPGIDFSNDPLLQGRLFSYTDTQISRLGGPNFHEIPINRPVSPNHNNQRDAQHRTTIDKGRASYEPNSIDGGWPKETPAGPQDGGFETYPERVEAHKVRERSPSFGDHFSQATLFFNSMSEHEKEHIIAAYSFELGKVEREYIRARQVNEILANIDLTLAQRVAANLGLPAPSAPTVQAQSTGKLTVDKSPLLSQANLLPADIASRKVAILVANVFIPGGDASIQALSGDGVALHYVLEAYKHLKAIAYAGDAQKLIDLLRLEADAGLLAVSDSASFKAFFTAIQQHRVWAREPKAKAIPA